MVSLASDLRYALRALGRSRGFTATVIATLALTIGANAAIFSIVDAALLRPLPFRDSERLVRIRDVQRLEGGGTRAINTSPENFRALAGSGLFEDAVAQEFRLYNLTAPEGARQVRGVGVSRGWLAFLGVTPALGRDFLPEESLAGGGGRVALLGSRLWRERFGQSPAAVGATLVLDGQAYTVVGVLPAWMNFPYDADLWTPARFDVADETHRLNVVARLRRGASPADLPKSLAALAATLERESPSVHAGWSFAAIPLRDELVEDRARVVLVLLAAVALLLAIACANLAALMLARAASRETEAEVRRALGAGTFRLLRPAILESLILAAAGAGGGVLLAVWSRRLLSSLTAPLAHDLAAFSDLTLNGRVLGYTASLAGAATLVLGLVPALRLRRRSSSLPGAARMSLAPGHRRMLSAITVVQVALVFLMLQSAGLLLENARRLSSRDLGFDRTNLLTMRWSLSADPWASPARRADLLERARRRVEAVPGVASADFTTLLPVGEGGTRATTYAVEDRPSTGREQLAANLRHVTAGYFRTLGVPMLRGRTYEPEEASNARPVAVVSRAMARRFWTEESAIGRRIKAGPAPAAPWLTIVGVVENVRDRGDVSETLYLPVALGSRTAAPDREPFLVVRTRVPSRSLAESVAQSLRTLDPGQPVSATSTMDEVYARTLAAPRQGAVVSSLVAAFALLLAALGIHGVLTYAIRQRRREIGIRIALGAPLRSIVALVVGQGSRLSIAGAALGAAAFLAGRGALMNALSGAGAPLETGTASAASVALLALVVLAACTLPAHRAAKVDPIAALRGE